MSSFASSLAEQGATGWIVAGTVVLFGLSFFFSGSETALRSLEHVERQRLEEDPRVGPLVLRRLRRRAPLLTSVLIGNESVNVAIAAFGAALVAAWFPEHPWLTVLLLPPALVLLSEITPKLLAWQFNVGWIRLAIGPLLVFHYAVTPVRLLVAGLVSVLSRGLRVSGERDAKGLHERELRLLIDRSAESGDVELRERDIIEAVFDFDDHTVGRLMTPRPDLFSVPLTIPWTDLLARCRDAGFSRVPVYEDETGDVVGVLLLKDLLRYRDVPPAGPAQLRALLLPAVFVPQSKPAQDMLRAFLERKFHMAFVVDEHGTLVGVVTLDDLLAELVGELLDADEETEEAIARVDDAYEVKAWMDVEDFAEATGITLPDGDYKTVGGFVFQQLGRLPAHGDEVYWAGYRFAVGPMQGRRLTEIQVSLHQAAHDQEAM